MYRYRGHRVTLGIIFRMLPILIFEMRSLIGTWSLLIGLARQWQGICLPLAGIARVSLKLPFHMASGIKLKSSCLHDNTLLNEPPSWLLKVVSSVTFASLIIVCSFPRLC